MPVKPVFGVCRWAGALVTSCFFFVAANAETVTLTPAAYASAEYNNVTLGYETLLPSGSLFVSSFPTYSQRTIFEFTLPPELQQPRVIIQRATLDVPVLDVTLTGAGSGMLHISGYAADETLTLEDFYAPTNLQSILPPTVPPDWHQRFDLTSFVSQFSQAFPGSNRMRLMAAVDVANYYVQWDPQATLEIEYTLEPLPELSVISPAQNSEHWTSDDIHLQASASDAQDGNLDAAIQWTLRDFRHTELLGTGGDFTVNLTDGIHRLEISVTDSDGNVVREYRDIDVTTPGNRRPELRILPDDNGGTVFEGMSMTVHAMARDLEDGYIHQNVVWTNEQGDMLAQSGALDLTLPVGSHTIYAEVTDSGGSHVFASFTVHVMPAPRYCTVGTTTTVPGWIAKTSVNGSSKVSASNGGYADFTATPFQIARGSNTIVLSAGGPDNINKYWGVWIDLNQDGVFSANEALVSVGRTPAQSTTRTFTIPSSTKLLGFTRMRVGVTYLGPPQPCGASDAGEFEDYSVFLPAL